MDQSEYVKYKASYLKSLTGSISLARYWIFDAAFGMEQNKVVKAKVASMRSMLCGACLLEYSLKKQKGIVKRH
jgi:formate-dependent nitrite reductase cytochrome c552 subunit